MFRPFGGKPENLGDLGRIDALIRARFDVRADDIVLVAADAVDRPGFPAFETNITFWKGDARYKLKIFKPISEVSDQDMPVKWLLPALIDDGEGECC